MNKTIIININGIVFHIEEDAYEVLRSYMIEVKKHFAYSADSTEIVSDIENRIAEMFSERIVAGKKEVIIMSDVEEVCAQMGRVSDFETNDHNDASYDYTQEASYHSAYTGTRKLFRDPDDKVFGGVCAGLGHYLDIETLWVRLAMVLLFVFAGTGFLLYVILWIVVPQAKTRADRMAMKGEAPNLQNFKKSFEEEMEGLRGNFTAAGESIKPGLSKAGDALEQLASFVAKCFVILLKVVGAIVIFGLCAGLVALLVTLVLATTHWGGNDGALFDPDFPLYFIPQADKYIVAVALFFSFAIPLIALILLAVRMVFNRKLAGSYVGFGLLIVWLGAVGVISYYAIETAEDFTDDATVVREWTLHSQPQYYLDIHDIHKITQLDTGIQSIDSMGAIIQSNRMRGKYKNRAAVSIRIVKSENETQPKVIREFMASGRDFDIAAKRAQRMVYNINQEEQHIVFDNYSSLPPGELLRNQRVNIKLVLPEGTRVFLSNEADRYIRDLPAWQCRDRYHETARGGYTAWHMTSEGLKCMISDEEEVTLPSDSTVTVDSVGLIKSK